MKSNFIETVISIPSENQKSAKVLININAINCIQENKEDKTTWIIMNGSEYHDIMHSLECYDAFKNQLVNLDEG